MLQTNKQNKNLMIQNLLIAVMGFFQLLTSILVIYNSWVPLRISGLDRISEYCIQFTTKC